MDDVRKSNSDPEGYAWQIFHLGDRATKDQLRRALAVILRKSDRDNLTIKRMAPLADAIDDIVRAALNKAGL